MLRSNSKSLGNHVFSPEEEKERLQWKGFAEKKSLEWNAFFDALRQLSGTHYRKLFSVVTQLQFLSLG